MTWTDRLRPRDALLSYPVLTGVSTVAFIIFLFTIGGGRPSGPGVFLALAVFVLGVVVNLLYRSARALVAPDAGAEEEQRIVGRRRKELEREYSAVKRALKDLEMDHGMGKLSDDDYGEIRGRYRERAVRIMRQLEQAPAEQLRRQIEQDLAARKAAAQAAAPAPAPAPGCARCETVNDGDATFCKKCGARLERS